jgi:hypothetical protein
MTLLINQVNDDGGGKPLTNFSKPAIRPSCYQNVGRSISIGFSLRRVEILQTSVFMRGDPKSLTQRHPAGHGIVGPFFTMN